MLQRSHSSAKKETTHLKSPTQRSFKHFLVLIVAKKNGKNGKNNLDKKNRERMNSINASSKNYLSKLEEKWKVIEAIINIKVIEAQGLVIVAGILPPRLVIVHRVVVVTVIIVCWKSKLICKLKS